MKFYRYDGTVVNYDGPKLYLREYRSVKETPCGHWIEPEGAFYQTDGYKRWISNISRKRFAYPTKEEALINLITRKERHIEILKAQLSTAKQVLYFGRKMAGEMACVPVAPKKL